jgi:glycosyltransferase involved in cell wall biosynthesis
MHGLTNQRDASDAIEDGGCDALLRERHRDCAKPEVVVFADDWGRHPSSAQHIFRHLLNDAAISWVNTIGTRTPTLDKALVDRALGKIRSWSGAAAPPANGGPTPRIFQPLMYPGFRSTWQRQMNAALLARFLRRRFSALHDTVIVSTIPIVGDLPDRLLARRWVYYCVDDFSVWPGLDSEALSSMERKFVARADRIVAAGDNLAARMLSLGREACVITHGIDLEHWRSRPSTNHLREFERPIVLFWGLIDRRLDINALRALDASMTSGTIVLLGPQQDPDPALGTLRRVRRPGPRPYESLPALAAESDVLIMPYADLPVTRAMQPLKLKEYLATGRPVVSTRLPATVGWEDCLDIVDGAEAFAAAVMCRCHAAAPSPQAAARAQRLEHESWRAKAAQFAEVLFSV